MRPLGRWGLVVLATAFVVVPRHVAAAEEVVPDVVGLEAQAALERLSAAGFRYVLERVPGRAEGKVFQQAPKGGSKREKGAAIYVRIGGQPASTPIPVPAPGHPHAAAGPTAPQKAPTPPAALARWRIPSRDGPPLPSTVGLLEAEATALLQGWPVQLEQTVGIPDLAGRVVNQVPLPGQRLARGETVLLVVARLGHPPELQATPRVRGQPLARARQVLTSHGFGIEVRLVAVPPGQPGMVFRQRPLAGSLLPEHGAVVLVVGGARDPETPRLVPHADAPPRSAASTLAAPMLISPSEGQRYPGGYQATFRWKGAAGAQGYGWALERHAPDGRWVPVAQEVVKVEAHRAARLPDGRYRWRVRALRGQQAGAWSVWFRLFFQGRRLD